MIVENFIEVYQSVKNTKSLIGCVSLKTIPNTMGMYSLKMLILFDCSNVSRFSEFMKNMTSMSVLNLMHHKSIVWLTNSISNL